MLSLSFKGCWWPFQRLKSWPTRGSKRSRIESPGSHVFLSLGVEHLVTPRSTLPKVQVLGENRVFGARTKRCRRHSPGGSVNFPDCWEWMVFFGDHVGSLPWWICRKGDCFGDVCSGARTFRGWSSGKRGWTEKIGGLFRFEYVRSWRSKLLQSFTQAADVYHSSLPFS